MHLIIDVILRKIYEEIVFVEKRRRSRQKRQSFQKHYWNLKKKKEKEKEYPQIWREPWRVFFRFSKKCYQTLSLSLSLSILLFFELLGSFRPWTCEVTIDNDRPCFTTIHSPWTSELPRTTIFMGVLHDFFYDIMQFRIWVILKHFLKTWNHHKWIVLMAIHCGIIKNKQSLCTRHKIKSMEEELKKI